MAEADYMGGSLDADHLCVLVHGFWGTPDHMVSIAKSLRAQHPRDKVYILLAERNKGNFTYDGIQTGGERVCLEIEETLKEIEAKGGKITKLSIVGYSLGGLVSRYAVGLLYAHGVLDTLECMNFTAFASPFLGIRAPLRGWSSKLWNVVAPRTLSLSGRQLFGIDKFRDTGRPLLAVLADPKSIFISGLSKFKRRTLYSNIINDRSATYYSTSISKTDPYTDTSRIRANYVKGYGDVIMDPISPFTPVTTPLVAPLSASKRLRNWFRTAPRTLAFMVLIPIGIATFLAASVYQTVRSNKRIQLHEKGLAGINVDKYRVPLLIQEFQGAVEGAYENLSASQNQEYLSLSEDSDDGEGGDGLGVAPSSSAGLDAAILQKERRASQAQLPTLALAPYQFAAIESLDEVGWRKYPVWIHEDGHSHAAIIVRWEKPTFGEGKVVLKHFAKEEFLL